MNTKTDDRSLQSLLKRACYSLFKFFASLKLAILVIVTLMIAMAVGTFLESMHGTDTARLVVYEARWFHIVLVLLGINVAAAALDRIPWQTKHIGFVATHFGILLILTGSFITDIKMIDGQMILQEGQTDYRITLPEPLVYVFSEKAQRDWIIPIKKRPFAWEGEDRIGEKQRVPVEINILSYYPKGYLEENYSSAEEGPGSIRVRVHNSFLDQELTLVENDPEQGSMPMGPAKFTFTDKLLTESKPTEDKQNPYLEFKFHDDNVRIPIDPSEKFPQTKKLPGKPYEIEVERVFQYAIVDGKELMENDAEDRRENSAVEFILKGEGVSEKHTAFTNFPDFPTMHGMQESKAGVQIFYRKPNSGSKGETHELRFVKSEDGFQYQVQDGFKVTTHDGVVGEDVSLGWMDLKFNVEEYIPNTKVKRSFTPAPNTSESERAMPSLQLQVKEGDQTKTFWLGQGLMETVQLGEHQYHFMYGQKRMPIGFKIKLRDFRMEKYPGTNQPASFESDVTLDDSGHGVREDVTISMNEPLEHRGFKIYQSGYHIEPGQPEISIFSVGRDPGIPFKYVGTIVMVLGIISMYFTRKYSTRAGKIG